MLRKWRSALIYQRLFSKNQKVHFYCANLSNFQIIWVNLLKFLICARRRNITIIAYFPWVKLCRASHYLNNHYLMCLQETWNIPASLQEVRNQLLLSSTMSHSLKKCDLFPLWVHTENMDYGPYNLFSLNLQLLVRLFAKLLIDNIYF